MSYCTIDDIKNVLSERELVNLTNDNPSQSTCIDKNRFEAVCLVTDSLINGYLRGRYELPLKSTPEFVKQIAQDICAYRLYSRRPCEIPEHIIKNYEYAINNLKEIKKGNLSLEDNSENPQSEIAPPKSACRVNKNMRDRIFNDQVMRCFGLPRGY